MVEIRLYNVGENAYRPELYGESIIVQRVVTNTSSTYKLKDHNVKNVVEKKVKEELDRILLSFNIQVRVYCLLLSKSRSCHVFLNNRWTTQ